MPGLTRVVCYNTQIKDPNIRKKASQTSRARRQSSKQDVASLMKQQSTPVVLSDISLQGQCQCSLKFHLHLRMHVQ